MSVEKSQQKKTAVQMAGEIGSDLGLPDKFWQDVTSFDLKEWSAFLVQSGPWLLDSLQQRITNLQKLVIEQETAVDLRKTFGVPLIALAEPVFGTLARMEAEARLALRSGAEEASLIVAQINSEIKHNLGLIFAAQLNELEEKKRSHQMAIQEVEAETYGQPQLVEVQSRSTKRLQAEIRKIEEEMARLTQLLVGTVKQVGQQINGVFEKTIFAASKQTLEVTAIK